MQQIFSLSKATYYSAVDALDAARQAQAMRDRITQLRSEATALISEALDTFDKKLEPLAPGPEAPPPAPAPGGRGGRGGGAGTQAPPDSLAGAAAALSGVMMLLQGADVRPTTVQLDAIAAARTHASEIMARWTTVKTTDLAALNAKLKSAGLATIVP
jgi:hypothetical protein